jgi:hypothetical protein
LTARCDDQCRLHECRRHPCHRRGRDLRHRCERKRTRRRRRTPSLPRMRIGSVNAAPATVGDFLFVSSFTLVQNAGPRSSPPRLTDAANRGETEDTTQANECHSRNAHTQIFRRGGKHHATPVQAIPREPSSSAMPRKVGDIFQQSSRYLSPMVCANCGSEEHRTGSINCSKSARALQRSRSPIEYGQTPVPCVRQVHSYRTLGTRM